MKSEVIPNKKGFYKFSKIDHSDISVYEAQMEIGSKVIISLDQPDQNIFCVAFGVLQDLKKKYIIVSLLQEKVNQSLTLSFPHSLIHSLSPLYQTLSLL
jgi:hypothetical protein